MDFWSSDLGEITGNSEDAFAKSFTLIPNNTMALAEIENFLNVSNQFNYLQIDWVITEGDYKGANITQKLKVLEADPRDKDPAKTRHRALNMLKLLYQLFNIQPQHNNPPTNLDLSIFIGKHAGLKIRETPQNEDGKSYNWVSEVHDVKGFKPEIGVKLEPPRGVDSALTRYANKSNDIPDSDIPF